MTRWKTNKASAGFLVPFCILSLLSILFQEKNFDKSNTIGLNSTQTQAMKTKNTADSIQTVAIKIHEDWLKKELAEGNTSKFKPIPETENLSPTEREKLAARLSKAKLDVDKFGKGIVVQEIMQAPDKIYPILMYALNGAPAKAYLKAESDLSNREKNPNAEPADLETLSSAIHDIWMENSPWEKDRSPHLFVPYSELPEKEKEKDRTLAQPKKKKKDHS